MTKDGITGKPSAPEERKFWPVPSAWFVDLMLSPLHRAATMETTMTMYWLITEPARGMSFRVPVTDETNPEAALAADERLTGEFVTYGKAVDDGDVDEAECSFKDWLSADYSVELKQEA